MLTFNKKKTGIILVIFIFTCFFFASIAQAEMQQLDDSDLSGVSGQALFTMDKISGTGSSLDSSTNLTFYRISLDAQVGFNMNIAKMQLGCGGVNQGIMAGCDIDLNNVRFMGQCSSCSQTANGFSQLYAGSAAISDFLLTRPYLELAISNPSSTNDDGSPTTRSLAGVAIGAQLANGYLSIGQYNDTSSGCAAGTSPMPTACHSGINSFSGYMSGYIQQSTLTGGTINILLGNANYTATTASSSTDPNTGQTVPGQFFEVTGTRVTAPIIPTPATATALGIPISIYAMLQDPLAFIHNVALQNTANFFLSFERQQIAWPTFDGKGYSHPANTGFWMNAPGVVIPSFNSPGAPSFSFNQTVNALTGAIPLQNVDIASRPVSNCYGSSSFC